VKGVVLRVVDLQGCQGFRENVAIRSRSVVALAFSIHSLMTSNGFISAIGAACYLGVPVTAAPQSPILALEGRDGELG